jgi:hypothetical protein
MWVLGAELWPTTPGRANARDLRKRNRRVFWLFCLAAGVRVTGVAGGFGCGRLRAGGPAARLTWWMLPAT